MRRVIATLWLTVAAVAAQDCTLEGVVTDSATGTPLAGARVSAPSATSVADQFTDSSGRFCFTGLDTLPRGVRVNLAGYRNWSSAVSSSRMERYGFW